MIYMVCLKRLWRLSNYFSRNFMTVARATEASAARSQLKQPFVLPEGLNLCLGFRVYRFKVFSGFVGGADEV